MALQILWLCGSTCMPNRNVVAHLVPVVPNGCWLSYVFFAVALQTCVTCWPYNTRCNWRLSTNA